MIVSIKSEFIEVTTHYSHGLQSGKIAMALKEELKPPYWLETLTAIVEHDDEQLNFERNNNLTDLGLPSDYRLVKSSSKDTLERCERIMEKSRHRSGWVSILVSMHLDFIYKDARKESDGLDKFLKEMAVVRKELRKVYEVTAKECDQYYEVLRFCDRLSLILIQGDVPADGRKLEINKSIENQRYFIYNKSGKLVVEPNPFAKSFQITSEIYKLKQVQFDSSDQLKNHLLQELPHLKTWEFEV